MRKSDPKRDKSIKRAVTGTDLTYDQIAKALDLTKDGIIRAAKRLKLPKRKRGRKTLDKK